MKTKSSDKKLKLNKTTISDLRSEDLQNIKAGEGITFTACPSRADTGCISLCGTIWPCSL
jgi:hypothetical protein